MGENAENDIKVNNFVVFGTINCRRMERVAICFKQYLSDLGKKFLLTPEAEILGMSQYGYNSRSFDNNFSHAGADYPGSTDMANRLHQIDASIGNSEFRFPVDLMTPPTSGKIILDDHEIDLANFSVEARKDIIKQWQAQNVWTYTEFTPPLGFVFSVNEPHFKDNMQEPGGWANGLQVHYNLKCIRPRAMIVCSKSMDMWLDWEFTCDSGDLVVCNWNTGTKFGTIKVISYYGENDTTLPRAEQRKVDYVIIKKLRRLLNKCRRESIHFILLGDLNSYSEAWNMPRNVSPDSLNWWRGEQWEDALLEYNISVLNQGNDWTFYSFASTAEQQMRSIIDVNMCSAGLDSLISNWSVRDAAPMGDHCSTEFLFHLKDSNIHETRDSL